jgi:hypothetical protein
MTAYDFFIKYQGLDIQILERNDSPVEEVEI